MLAPTYGVILYQEQVMQIAQVLAGYTLGGADLLRRAMGKKKPEEMAKQRGNLRRRRGQEQRARERRPRYIFDLMEKFAGYGFNKSHSAAYALLSYQTGWLKAHEPASYMAAVLSADMDHTDKVVEPAVRLPQGSRPHHPAAAREPVAYEFAVVDDKTIRYGLGAIKGVGEGAVQAIVNERRAHGDYASLEDLCRRLDLSKINRRVLEALIKSGSLDGLAANRATLMHRLDAALALGEQNSKANETGQHDIFGLAAAHVPEAVRVKRAGSAGVDRQRAAARRARDAGPRDLRSSHRPLRQRSAALHHRPHRRLPRSGEARGERRRRPRVLRRQAGGDRRRGRGIAQARPAHRGPARRRLRAASQVSFFDEQYQQFREILVKDALLLIEGKLRFDEFANTWVLRATKVSELERLREKEARRIVLKLKSERQRCRSRSCRRCWRSIAAAPARWPCSSTAPVRAARISFGAEWNVRPSPALIEELEKLVGARPHRGALQPAAGELLA